MYSYFTNAVVYLIMGGALLLVWCRHSSQAFARDLGCSTIAAGLIPLGYLAYTNLPSPWHMAGLLLVLFGAIPNLLLLTSAALRLAGRRLPQRVMLLMVVAMTLLLTLPSTAQRMTLWPTVNLSFFIALGVLITRWMWRTNAVERLVGPLLIVLGLIGCAANLVFQGGVKSADGKAVLAFDSSAQSVAVRCTGG